jgi:hypothetical protein
MKARKIALAIGALLAGSTAMGATLPGGGNSNLFLIVYNSADTNGETYVQALTPTISTLPTTTTSYGVDTSLSQLEQDVGTTSAANLTYAVVAANDLGGQIQLDFTASAVTITAGGQVNNGAGLLNAWLGNIGIGTSQNSAVESSGVLTFTGHNGAGADLGIGGSSQNTTGAATGSPLEFYAATVVPAGRTTDANVVDQHGTFSFSLANDSVTYTPASQTSPVPVPAAVWLLLSGLAGVAGLSRRNGHGNATAIA